MRNKGLEHEGTVSLCSTAEVSFNFFRSNGMEGLTHSLMKKFNQYEILEYRISMS